VSRTTTPPAPNASTRSTAAVEKQQPFGAIDGETARIDNAAVIAERTDWFAIAVKR
jgi:hypothetical protein